MKTQTFILSLCCDAGLLTQIQPPKKRKEVTQNATTDGL